MVTSGLEEATALLKVELKSAMMVFGEQCAVTCGIPEKQWWFVDNLDFPVQVL